MPRRQQYKKKNKRHRKGSYDGDSRYNQSSDNATSLEEDLKQQRIRQQERDKLLEIEEEKMRIEKEAEDEVCKYDVDFQPLLRFETNGHAIANAVARTNHLMLKGAVLPVSTVPLFESGDDQSLLSSLQYSSVIRLPPSFLLRHIEQTSPMLSVHKRNTLRKLWPTQHHLETMTVLPRAASLYCKTKWPQHHTEYNSDLRCSWDLSCKHRLHPSARTLDVAMLSSEPTPTIATIFQDGWGLLRQKSQHKINTIKAPPAYSIRMHEPSSMCGMIVKQVSSTNRSRHHPQLSSNYSFRWYPLPHATSYVEAHLPRPVTDFCFGKDIALFSCPRYSAHSHSSSETLNPLFLPLLEAGNTNGDSTYYNSAVRMINVRNFPQSDAMRVEMMCEQQEKLVAFGHRNGQVSVLDLRASGTVCSILQCEASASESAAKDSNVGAHPLGSVSDLGFLSTGGNQYQILVKRSFGSCQLHDLRKASSSSTNRSSNHTSTTVVRNMSVPYKEIHPMLTANCNGFAIDPNGHQTMVSPYISSPNGDARLGVWSLKTGHMVGSHLLLANSASTSDNDEYKNREGTTLYAEVCSKTTPSQRPNGGTNNDNDNIDNGDSIDHESSFGVWLKCGAITNGKLRSRVGSLHQVTIPGRWKSDEVQRQNGAS